MQYSDKKQRTRVSKILRRVVAMVCVIALTFAELIYAVTAETDNRKLLNGSFEKGQTFTGNYSQPNQSAVPSWNTTAFQGKIELFRENTTTYIPGVTLAPTDGTYAAELNADEESTLYQNVQTTPSNVYKWGLDHGGRNGKDIMALVIGPKQDVNPSKPSKEGRDQFMQMVDWLNIDVSTITAGAEPTQYTVYSKKFAANGTFEDNAGNNAFSLTRSSIYTEEWHIWIMASSRATSGTNPWNSYGSNATSTAGSGNGSGNTGVDLSKYYFYTVPAGQTDTLFGFVSVGYVDSITTADKAKTYGNFLDNINFQIFHPLSGSSTTHGSAIVGGSDGSVGGSGASSGHEVTVDNNLKTYVTDGETLKIQAVIKAADLVDGCQFVGVYHTRQDESGNPVSEFIQVSGNVIEDTGSLTDEEKAGKWVKSTNTNGDVFYTYYIENLTSPTDLHFIFIKNPTVTYDPNGGMPYIIENRPHPDEEDENVYSFKPLVETVDENSFIKPYVSKAAEGKNDGWKFVGWKLMGDVVDQIPQDTELVEADKLGSLVLPAVHTIACDYDVDGATEETAAQYFKIYGGDVSLAKQIIKTGTKVNGVKWNDSGETKLYANVHRGLTMVAQWRWRQAFIPQLDRDGEYIESTEGGTVEVTSVIDKSDENYSDAYTVNGGKSYYAGIDELVIVKAVAKSGCKFIGWYDESGKLITTNEEYAFVESKESVKTFYARFSNSITQTYIGDYAFEECTSLKNVYYGGTKAQWNKVEIWEGNDCLTNANIHCTDQGKWLKSGNRWWYRHADGSYTKNDWEKIDGKWYHFDKDGWMQTGWLKDGGKWYYLNSSGVMTTGWQKVSNKWYYMNSSGVMQTGWEKIGGKWYYFNSSGVMQTGWLKLGGKWYYLNSSGVMLTGRQKIGNKWYTFNSSGVWVK